MTDQKGTTGPKERIMSKDGWASYYISAVPWVGCPFNVNIVVVTKNGREDAVRVFKEVYQNDALDIKEIYEITLVRSDMWDEMKEEIRNKAN